jgi:pyruvate ferredoxin oxidoreductase gamma subunit
MVGAEVDMVRIRIHGRGGQGIKTAGRMLGSAMFLEGFEVQDAPRYGAERRGAPIVAFIRADSNPINERGLIADPDLVVVVDDTLMGEPTAGVLQGLGRHSVLLIAGGTDAAVWRTRVNPAGPVIVVPAGHDGGPETLPRSGLASIGAAARLIGTIGRASLEEAVRAEATAAGVTLSPADLHGVLAAYDAMADRQGCVGGGERHGRVARPDWIDLRADDVDHAAPAVHRPATSVLVRTGLWRTMRPVIDRDRCRRCVWVCGEFCPDNAIVVDAEGFPSVDYDHCKGCLICVAQCPTHAIRAVPEHDAATAEAAS